MAILQRPSASPSSSTAHLLQGQPREKDYASAFGALADTYGFGAPSPDAPHAASCAPPPPSPVHVIRLWPSSSPTSSSSLVTGTGTGLPLRARLLALLKQRSEPSTTRQRLARRSAPNLRRVAPSTRCLQNIDKVQRARDYEAAFAALQAEHGFVIGSALPAHRSQENDLTLLDTLA